MPDQQPGDYVCVRTSGFVSFMIRLFTRSRYDHAFIVVTDDGGIIEAEPDGARLANITEYTGELMVSNQGEPTTEQQRATVVEHARGDIGVPYGFLDIVRLGLASLGLRWGWLTRAADEEKAMVCSQLVAACGVAAGLDWLCGQESPAAVTPGMLAKRAERHQWA